MCLEKQSDETWVAILSARLKSGLSFGWEVTEGHIILFKDNSLGCRVKDTDVERD